MPFTKIKSGKGKGKYRSPSGNVLTSNQVEAYYTKNPITMKTGPFKMKGWSPFTQKTHPKHPVTPPTEKQKSTLEKSRRDPLLTKIHDYIAGKKLPKLFKDD
jgi:hypothetical protein